MLGMSRLSPRTSRALGTVAAIGFLMLSGCAPEEKSSTSASDPVADQTDLKPVLSCTIEDLNLKKPGTLTIATDSPAYDPWFSKDDPTNGEGFESSVAYALAEEMGFTREDVEWVTVRFNNSYKPGPKDFDFDINQISITPERQKVVDFSTGYYSAAQAVFALKGTAGADATSLADLKGLRLGAQTGTTSLTAIREVIQPDAEPLVFNDTNAAKQALQNDQVDAVVADLPTALYITAAEIPKSTIIGQFQPETGEQEEFGLLFEKGNPLVECVDFYLEGMKEAGVLAQLEQKWLKESTDIPDLK